MSSQEIGIVFWGCYFAIGIATLGWFEYLNKKEGRTQSGGAVMVCLFLGAPFLLVYSAFAIAGVLGLIEKNEEQSNGQ